MQVNIFPALKFFTAAAGEGGAAS